MGVTKTKEREREERRTKTTMEEENMEEWKRAKGLSQMTFPTTRNVGLGKNCPEILLVEMRIRMMVAKTRRTLVKVLLNELEY